MSEPSSKGSNMSTDNATTEAKLVINDDGSSNNAASVTDPFTQRTGCSLSWDRVSLKVDSNNNNKAGSSNHDVPFILDNVWGNVPVGQTTAIMGPSGAGKTSLLNIIAGRTRSKGKTTVTSTVLLNNQQIDPLDINYRRNIAFVTQTDSLPTTSTVREAIFFSAKLRLPRTTTNKQLDQLVTRMMDELGLSSCADTVIGGSLIKGISGGERKRTAVAVELVVRPSLVFLDEPTSGLDSYSAVQLCNVLKKVAKAGSSVLFTIHQPSSETFESFDRLILLNKGRVMYQGLVSQVQPFFCSCGFPCPSGYNQADWVLNVAQSVSVSELEKNGFFVRDSTDDDAETGVSVVDHDTVEISLHKPSQHYTGDKTSHAPPPGLYTQITALFHRDVLDFCRNTKAVGARFVITAFLSILIGMIFFKVGESDKTVGINSQSHFGALTMVLITSMFGTAQPPLIAFPEERPVFLREYSTNHYSVLAYFLSRLVNEIVLTGIQLFILCAIVYYMVKFQGRFVIFFLVNFCLGLASTALSVLMGSLFEDAKAAAEMIPTLLVPQILFSGFFVAPALIPVFLRWSQYICTLTYAVRIAVVEEFGNCKAIESDECNRIVQGTDSSPDDTWWYWLVLVSFFVCFRLIALIVLQRRATF